MKIDKYAKYQLGVGLSIIILSAFTINYLLKQFRGLVNLDFEFSKIKVNKLNLKEVSLTLFWQIINPSDISFTIKKQKYDVYLNDKFVKTVGSDVPVEILAKGTSMLPTFVDFTVKEMLMSGIENLSGFITEEGRKKLKVTIKGKINITLPIMYDTVIPVDFSDTLHNMMNY